MPYAYVSNFPDGSVSVIDMATHVARTTLLPALNHNPLGLALTPDKKRLFVTLFDTGDVYVLDAASGFGGSWQELGFPSVGISARGVAVTPDGKRAYVASTIAPAIPADNPGRGQVCMAN